MLHFDLFSADGTNIRPSFSDNFLLNNNLIYLNNIIIISFYVINFKLLLGGFCFGRKILRIFPNESHSTVDRARVHFMVQTNMSAC